MVHKGWLMVCWTVVMGSAIASCQEASLNQLIGPSYEFQLAEYLSNTEAKMYGAYWCPHCARQKQLFGDAARSIPYVECDPRGVNAQVNLCNTAGINAYPTWEINGEFYLGAQPLKQLAILSGFEVATEPVELDDNEWGNFSPAP
ncbi:MAG: hypothetical protein KTR27_11355 [Leptolyngbyaceae cyanobacterium MAG.088]|nr:hypothetical protein [Leptolyngbyaceae cyanobacterium MAG.088]